MYQQVKNTVEHLLTLDIPSDRKKLLKPLSDYIFEKITNEKPVNLNFICTHNSRRSHLSQIWMQVASSFFKLNNLHTYSGGTEATAMYAAVRRTLESQGLVFSTIKDGDNPIYGIRYSEECSPIVAFSKKYDHKFNPSKSYAAIMTCDHADQNCPLILGAEQRIPVTYIDPKVSDGTDQQVQVYMERSEQIAAEMLYVIRTVKGIIEV